MINIPDKEQKRFEGMLRRQAQEFGLSAEEYLRKVWYHEQASRLGEYTAIVLTNDLLELVPHSIVCGEEQGEHRIDEP